MNGKVGLIGIGRMGEALLKGFLQVVGREGLLATDIRAERRRVAEELGVEVAVGNEALAREVQWVVLAVKPKEAEEVVREIADGFSEEKVLLSIVAGLKTATIHSWLEGKGKVIRAMPNLPLQVFAGAVALCGGPGVGDGDLQRARELFSSLGETVVVSEELMDTVTGLSGSGPAYVALFIEAMAEGGVRMGLGWEEALRLSAQTVLGTAKMVLGGEHPALLKGKVASPGGTTVEGLAVLEAWGLRAALIEAVEAATVRSKELGSRG